MRFRSLPEARRNRRLTGPAPEREGYVEEPATIVRLDGQAVDAAGEVVAGETANVGIRNSRLVLADATAIGVTEDSDPVAELEPWTAFEDDVCYAESRYRWSVSSPTSDQRS